jgi:rubrerythrin
MSKFGSVDQALDFAIEREEESARFYGDLAGAMERPAMRQVFEAFAREEVGHKDKLLGVKRGRRLLSAETKVADLKVADYLVEAQPSPGMDYREALILAMKREKAAFKLYHDLAGAAGDEEVRRVFLSLAQEEARHKLRFEIEYDEVILKQA